MSALRDRCGCFGGMSRAPRLQCAERLQVAVRLQGGSLAETLGRHDDMVRFGRTPRAVRLLRRFGSCLGRSDWMGRCHWMRRLYELPVVGAGRDRRGPHNRLSLCDIDILELFRIPRCARKPAPVEKPNLPASGHMRVTYMHGAQWADDFLQVASRSWRDRAVLRLCAPAAVQRHGKVHRVNLRLQLTC